MNAEKARARRLAAIHRNKVSALALSMPPALAGQFHSLSHCMEASIVGARILRDGGIEARAVPCAIRACNGVSHRLTVGYSRAEIAELTGREPESIADLSDNGFHVMIEAYPAGERTFVDLTLGQLLPQAVLNLATPTGLPAIEFRDWRVEYYSSPRAAYVDEQIALAEAMPYEGLRDDVEVLMDLAEQCKCDRVTFLAAMMRANPEPTLRYVQAAENSLVGRMQLAP